MILADKIINERKKNGWSQEELADKLSVSRQSVSKWEGAQSVPDLNRIIQMSELFNVSIDYLLKDEIEPEEVTPVEAAPVEAGTIARKVSMEEARNYLNTVKSNNVKAVVGSIAFILSPVILIFLAGLADSNKFGISESLASGIGLLALAVFCAVGFIFTFLVGKSEKPYEYLKTEDFDSEYGVSGMVKEELKANESKFATASIIAFLCFIFCPAGVIGAALAGAADWIIVSMLCVLFLILATGLGIMQFNGRIKDSLKTLLNERKDRNKEAVQKKMKIVNRIYWTLAVVIFLILGLIFSLWKYTGAFWIVAGLIYVVVHSISKAVIAKE